MDQKLEAIEVGSYLLEAGGGEAGTLIEQGGGGAAETKALREAFEKPEPSGERAPALATEIDEAAEATTKIEQAAALCKGAAEGHALDPDQLALEVGTLLDCLERLDHRKKHKKAIQLARSLSTLLMLLKRWASLLQTLRIALRAGEELGDEAAVAWAEHELGTLMLAAGDVEGAERDLRRAREIREKIGDRRGLAATNRNLQVLCDRLQKMLRNEELVRPPSPRPFWLRAFATAAVCAFLFAAGVAAGAIVGDDPTQERVAETQGTGEDTTHDNAAATDTHPIAEYILGITILGEGSGTITAGEIECLPPRCELEFRRGTIVRLGYSADNGSFFGGFSGDCSGESCILKMDTPKAVSAIFEPEASEASGSNGGSLEESEGEEAEEARPRKLSEPEEEEEEEEEELVSPESDE